VATRLSPEPNAVASVREKDKSPSPTTRMVCARGVVAQPFHPPTTPTLAPGPYLCLSRVVVPFSCSTEASVSVCICVRARLSELRSVWTRLYLSFPSS
jgi:hypothetical protein